MKSLLPLIAMLATSVAAEPPHPKLIVAISVDQFSADLFAEYRQHYAAGLKRLSNAIVFPSGFQSHATTETCPGHSTLLTGSHPARTGIIANSWFDETVTRPGKDPHAVYCAEDERAAGSNVTDYVVSAEHLRVPTMGDRMKRADPRSRVVAVAGKDRAAVMMGGHMLDAIWYLDPKKGRSYVTLPERDPTPPAVVQSVNARVAGLIDHPAAIALPPECIARSVPIHALPDGPIVGQLTAHQAGDVKAFRTSPRATTDSGGSLRQLRLGHLLTGAGNIQNLLQQKLRLVVQPTRRQAHAHEHEIG